MGIVFRGENFTLWHFDYGTWPRGDEDSSYWLSFFLNFFQDLMSQMEEHNSTHALLSAQMKNLNVSLMNGSTCRLKNNCVEM